MKLYILGAGSFAREATSIVDDIRHPYITIEGYVVDVDEYPATVLGRDVQHVADLTPDMVDQRYFVAAIVSPERRNIIAKVKHFTTVIRTKGSTVAGMHRESWRRHRDADDHRFPLHREPECIHRARLLP